MVVLWCGGWETHTDLLVRARAEGKPPKKDGANSMWGKKSEAPNIVNLRNAAFRKREETIKTPFNSRVSLDLVIYAPESELERMGDLDNFITGVCDGLQGADARAKMHEIISRESEVDPRLPLLLYTDAKVFEITAKKRESQDMGWHYKIRLNEI